MILLVTLLFLSFLVLVEVVLLLVRGDGLGHRTPPRSHHADAFEPGHRVR